MRSLRKFTIDGKLQIVSVAAFKGDKLLFGRRNDTGKYTLPGGHMEEGEAPVKAAIRELIEETGLRPTAFAYLGSGDVISREGKELTIHCYRAQVNGIPTAANDPDNEIGSFHWVETIPKLPDAILGNLEAPKNVTLRLLGLQKDWSKEVSLNKAEPDNMQLDPSVDWNSLPEIKWSYGDPIVRDANPLAVIRDIDHNTRLWHKLILEYNNNPNDYQLLYNADGAIRNARVLIQKYVDNGYYDNTNPNLVDLVLKYNVYLPNKLVSYLLDKNRGKSEENAELLLKYPLSTIDEDPEYNAANIVMGVFINTLNQNETTISYIPLILQKYPFSNGQLVDIYETVKNEKSDSPSDLETYNKIKSIAQEKVPDFDFWDRFNNAVSNSPTYEDTAKVLENFYEENPSLTLKMLNGKEGLRVNIYGSQVIPWIDNKQLVKNYLKHKPIDASLISKLACNPKWSSEDVKDLLLNNESDVSVEIKLDYRERIIDRLLNGSNFEDSPREDKQAFIEDLAHSFPRETLLSLAYSTNWKFSKELQKKIYDSYVQDQVLKTKLETENPETTPEEAELAIKRAQNIAKYSALQKFTNYQHKDEDLAKKIFYDLSHEGKIDFIRNNEELPFHAPLDELKQIKSDLQNGSSDDMDYNYSSEREYKSYKNSALVKLDEKIGQLDPDSVHDEHALVKIGTNKVRKIRDIILATGKDEMKPKELPPGDWSMGRMPNGNISATKLQSWIDAQPAHKFNLSHTEWDGAQRHNDQPSKVLQVNMTTDKMNQMQQAGVYKTFKDLHDVSFRSGHPVTKNTLGWIRYTDSDDLKTHFGYKDYKYNDYEINPRTGNYGWNKNKFWNYIRGNLDRLIDVNAPLLARQADLETVRGYVAYHDLHYHEPTWDEEIHKQFLPDFLRHIEDVRQHYPMAYRHFPDDLSQVKSMEDLKIPESAKTPFDNNFVPQLSRQYNVVSAKIMNQGLNEAEKLKETPEYKSIRAIGGLLNKGAVLWTKGDEADFLNHIKTIRANPSHPFLMELQDSFPSFYPETGKAIIYAKGLPKPVSPGIFIDEIQTDFGQTLGRQAATQARQHAQQQGMGEAETEAFVNQTVNQTEEKFPSEHLNKITEILFHGKKPNEVLMDTFLQHMRDKGKADHPVNIHSVNTKAKFSLGEELGEKAAPAHFQFTYGQLPAKIGFEPTTYGKTPTENSANNDEVNLTGEQIWGGKVRKFEPQVQSLAKVNYAIG